MTKQVLLILNKAPVPRGAVGPVNARTPDVAVVYATPAGEVAVFDPGKRDRWTNRVFSHYRLRYEVDLGDHRHTVELRSSPLPARGGIYHFTTFIDVGFRVVDPGAIVSRDVDDGLVVVYNHLIDLCRPITREFDIEDAAGAEDAINARFRHGETLEEGIYLYRCRARLSADTNACTYLQSQEEAKRDNIVKFERHKVDTEDAKRRNQIDLIKQSGALEAQARERDAMGNRPLDVRELIAIHLERYPKDTQTALQLLSDLERARWDRQDMQDQKSREMFEFLASRNLIHAVDLGRFRDQVMTQLQNPSPVLPPASGQSLPPLPGASGWDDPLPALGSANARSVPMPSVVDGPTMPQPPVVEPHRLPDVVPVYVVIDQSIAVEGCVVELNAGVNSLYDALIAEPVVASVIRLSLFGYADNVVVQLALATVRDGTERVHLSAHGQSHYAAAFERLLDCIPRDIEQLKTQQPNVRRPQVLFLSGAQPADDTRWSPIYQRLVDRGQHRYAPDIVACGVGAANAETIARIATRRELAFVADDGHLARSVERYFAFVVRQVISYGRSVLDGRPGPLVTAPDGFRPARDLV
ncbi:MAG: hypothetical protein DLM61_16115 [Pseudonocardiales bacterium]|nr:MAG: hypothetical protein DLM61_16115 [Pseudonocardiales bacterium]